MWQQTMEPFEAEISQSVPESRYEIIPRGNPCDDMAPAFLCG